MKMQFFDSEGKVLFEKEHAFTKSQPRDILYVGKNLYQEQIHGNFTIKTT